MCNACGLLDCMLMIIEPRVDYGFHEIRELQNFSLWLSHTVVCFLDLPINVQYKRNNAYKEKSYLVFLKDKIHLRVS